MKSSVFGLGVMSLICLCPQFVYAQFFGILSNDAEEDDYYKGDIARICAKADPEKETLTDAKDYCQAYPKNCIGNKAVCRSGMPVNAYTSTARNSIYRKNLASYKNNTKTVCKDFPWTCADFAQKLEAAKTMDVDELDQDKPSRLLKQLPKNAVVCEDNDDCKGSEACVTYDYLKTGTINVCKKAYHLTCHNDLNCPDEQYCYHGKCIECIDNDKTVMRLGMKCSQGRWVVDTSNGRPKMPCHGNPPCQDGFSMMRLILTDGTERCVCVYNYNSEHTDIKTFEFNKNCVSNLDCQDYEVCNTFYQKCVDAENDVNLDGVLDDVLSLPNGLPNASEAQLKKQITSYKKQMDKLQDAAVEDGKFGDSMDKIDDIQAKLTKAENMMLRYDKFHYIDEIMKAKNKRDKMRHGEDFDDDNDDGDWDSEDWNITEIAMDADTETLNYLKGIIYLKDGNYNLKNAFKYIKMAADKGKKEAQFVLAMMYIHGQGTSVNENKGFWYLNQVFKPESKKKIASYAYVGALSELINCYRFGIGTEKNEAKVEELKHILVNSSGSISDLDSFYEKSGMIRFCDTGLSDEDVDNDVINNLKSLMVKP